MNRYDKLSLKIYGSVMKRLNAIAKAYSISFFVIIVYLMVAFAAQQLFSSFTISNIITDVFAILLAYLIYRMYRKDDKVADSFEPMFDFSIKKVAVIIPVAILFSYMSITASLFINRVFPSEIADESYSLPYFIICGIILAPIAEEILYRLCVYNILKTASHYLVAMFVMSFLFGIFHGTLYHIFSGTLFSMILVLSYEFLGRNLIIPILLHMIYNTMTVFMTEDMFFYKGNVIPIVFMICMVLLVVGYAFIFNKKYKSLSHIDK